MEIEIAREVPSLLLQLWTICCSEIVEASIEGAEAEP